MYLNRFPIKVKTFPLKYLVKVLKSFKITFSYMKHCNQQIRQDIFSCPKYCCEIITKSLINFYKESRSCNFRNLTKSVRLGSQ